MVYMKNIILVSLLVLVILVSLIFYTLPTFQQKQSFEEKREELLEQLYSNIGEAGLEGKYKCCIEPPCTMCYLGQWLWDNGTCACDDMIAKEEFDKVCPQCKRGIEEGKCKSTTEKMCEVNLEFE